MRRVTAKPPNMLTAVSASASTASPRISAFGRSVAPPLTGGGGDRPSGLILGLAVLALVLTAVNMFGGFAVTRRMLAMFRK